MSETAAPRLEVLRRLDGDEVHAVAMLVEDVIDAIAVLDESPEFDRAALNRFVGLTILCAVSITAWSERRRRATKAIN